MPHNFYRGAHLSVYDVEARSSIAQLRDTINVEMATAVWDKAISTKWNKDPVWIHGDFSSGNFLIKEGKVTAVIDFGCVGIGDPACDLVLAWTFFSTESRKVFQSNLNLDSDTWARGRGWALWKACLELVAMKDKSSLEVIKQQAIINEVINQHLKSGL